MSDRPRRHPCFGCGDLATMHFSLQVIQEHPSRSRIAAGVIDLMPSVLETSDRGGEGPSSPDPKSGPSDWWPLDYDERCECRHLKYAHRGACLYCDCASFTLEPTLGL